MTVEYSQLFDNITGNGASITSTSGYTGRQCGSECCSRLHSGRRQDTNSLREATSSHQSEHPTKRYSYVGVFLPDSLPLYNIAKAASDPLHWVSFRRTLIYESPINTPSTTSWEAFQEQMKLFSGPQMTSFTLNPHQFKTMLQPGSPLNDLSEEQQLVKTLLTADPQVSKSITDLLDSQGAGQPASFFQVFGSEQTAAEVQAAMEEYAMKLSELQSMGFTDMVKNKVALATSQGDLEGAIRILTGDV